MEKLNTLEFKNNFSKIWKVVSGLIIVALALLLFKSCEATKTITANNNALNKGISEYRLKNGLLVKSVSVLQLDKRTLKEQVLEKDLTLKEMASKFSRVVSVNSSSIKTTIPEIKVPFKEPITILDIDSTSGKLKFERTGAVFEKWYEFGYKVTQDTLTVEPFSTWTEIKRVDGFKRKWFLGRQSLHSDISLTNPFVDVIETKTVIVPIPKAWHETRVFNMLLGGAIMYGITR